jgi:hypothetical protein
VQLVGPGNKNPGDTVQMITAVLTANETITGTTYVAGATNRLSITPSSAANLIVASFTGSFSNVAAGRTATVRLSRGTTNNTNLIGSEARTFNGSGGDTSAYACLGCDFPNVTTSQTYALQAKVDTTGMNLGQNITSFQQLIEVQT